MAETKKQEKVIPVTFGGSKYKVTVSAYPGGFIVKRTVLEGYESPLGGVLSSLCRDQITAALEEARV